MKMNILTKRILYIFVPLVLGGLFACSEFDLPLISPFNTYIKTFGSSDFDVAFDAVYLKEEDNYLVIGSSGPLKTGARAFIAKIDRQSGRFIDYKIVGNNFDRIESLKHIIETKNKDFKVVGFSQFGGDSRMLLASFNSDLKDIVVENIESDGDKDNWEEGNNILEIEDGFLISGSWDNKLGGVYVSNKNSFIRAGFFRSEFGRIQDAYYDERGYGIMVGHFCPNYHCRAMGGTDNIFIGRYSLESANLIHKNDSIHPQNYQHSSLQALTQINADSSYIAIGKVWNNDSENKIVFARFDFDLNLIGELVIYDGENKEKYFGDNASARNIVAVEDGVVITGFEADFDKTNSDLLIAKLDFNGNLIWKRTYDWNGQDDFGWSILYDGAGFFIVGQSKITAAQGSTLSSSVLILKTDIEGVVKNN